MKIFSSIVVLILGAALQLTEAVSFLGIKPNIVLGLLVVYAFFISELWIYAILVLIADVSIMFNPGVSKEILVLSVVAFVAYWLKKKFLDSSLLTVLILLGLGTLFFDLLVSWQMILSFGFIVELVYNLVLGTIVYEVYDLLSKRYAKKTVFRI